EHRQRGLRGQHARQVRRATGAGDDRLQAARTGGGGVFEQRVGRAVRRDHADLVRDTELFELPHRMLHGLPVGSRTHHDPDHGQAGGGGHWPSPVAKTYSSGPTPRLTAMDRKLLDILVCPTSRQPLALLEASGLEALNRAIAAGGVRRGDDAVQTAPLREALITRDRRMAYRVDDGIPVLLAEEGIQTSQVA